MRAVRRSPLFRIALLSLAVLFAHTIRANAQPIIPACPPCPGKVASAQPDSEKKLAPAVRRIIRPDATKAGDHLSGSFDVAVAYDSSVLFLRSSAQVVFARRTVDIQPQRRPFALRI